MAVKDCAYHYDYFRDYILEDFHDTSKSSKFLDKLALVPYIKHTCETTRPMSNKFRQILGYPCIPAYGASFAYANKQDEEYHQNKYGSGIVEHLNICQKTAINNLYSIINNRFENQKSRIVSNKNGDFIERELQLSYDDLIPTTDKFYDTCKNKVNLSSIKHSLSQHNNIILDNSLYPLSARLHWRTKHITADSR